MRPALLVPSEELPRAASRNRKIISSGASSRLAPKAPEELFSLPAGGDRTFRRLPLLLAVAGLPVRRGLPSRSPMHHAPRFRVAEAKNAVASLWITGISGTTVGTFVAIGQSWLTAEVAVPFSFAYLGHVSEVPRTPVARARVSRGPEPAAARGGADDRRPGAGPRRRGHGQDRRADRPARPPDRHPQGLAQPDPRRDLHQQGRARDEGARVRNLRRRDRGHALARHLPLGRRADAPQPCRARRPPVQFHHPRHRRPAARAQAADQRRQPRREALARAPARRPHRPLEEPRLDSAAGRRRRSPRASPPAAAPSFTPPTRTACKTLNACDFGDLLLHMLVIFRTPRRRARQLPRALPIHPRRRISGHQPGASTSG